MRTAHAATVGGDGSAASDRDVLGAGGPVEADPAPRGGAGGRPVRDHRVDGVVLDARPLRRALDQAEAPPDQVDVAEPGAQLTQRASATGAARSPT